MKHCPGRRRFLHAAAVALPLIAAPELVMGAPGEQRRLRFYHTHTGEKLDVVYHENGVYLPDALSELDFLLRDFRSGEVAPMDSLISLRRGGAHGLRDARFPSRGATTPRK
jgi:uncharacterized protein YcbK (DUF882 family)